MGFNSGFKGLKFPPGDRLYKRDRWLGHLGHPTGTREIPFYGIA